MRPVDLKVLLHYLVEVTRLCVSPGVSMVVTHLIVRHAARIIEEDRDSSDYLASNP